MRTIGNWPKNNIIIVDNLVNSFANDIENGIPIKPYIKGKVDYELEFIANLLSGVKQETNLVEYLGMVMNLNKFYKYF